MSVQNPTIPTPTAAKGIDAVIVDLQTHLSFDLAWLTNGMGRAYRIKKSRSNGSTEFQPMIYLGIVNNEPQYYPALPDNDKEGQSIILVGDGTYPNQQRGFYGIIEYPVSLIFSANLKTINSTLLETEIFTEHLMEDVRQSLIRNTLGKSYQFTIDSETIDFDTVYSEFDINTDAGKTNKPLAPMTYFRFDLTLQVKESCPPDALDRCTAITQNLTADDKNECILPTYDFSDATVQSNVTAGQQTDLMDWLCTTPTPSACNTFFKGLNEYADIGTGANIDFDIGDTFSFSAWINVDSFDFTWMVAKYANPRGWLFGITPTGGLRLFLANNGSTSGMIADSVGSNIQLGAWVFVTGSTNGNGLTSGVELTINTSVQTISAVVETLGGNNFNSATSAKIAAFTGGGYFIGGMTNLAIFDTVLTSGEISALYALGKDNAVAYPTASVVSHYLMDALNPSDEVGFNNGTSFNQDSSNIICP